jgi:hypothetical protein
MESKFNKQSLFQASFGVFHVVSPALGGAVPRLPALAAQLHVNEEGEVFAAHVAGVGWVAASGVELPAVEVAATFLAVGAWVHVTAVRFDASAVGATIHSTPVHKSSPLHLPDQKSMIHFFPQQVKVFFLFGP